MNNKDVSVHHTAVITENQAQTKTFETFSVITSSCDIITC